MAVARNKRLAFFMYKWACFSIKLPSPSEFLGRCRITRKLFWFQKCSRWFWLALFLSVCSKQNKNQIKTTTYLIEMLGDIAGLISGLKMCNQLAIFCEFLRRTRRAFYLSVERQILTLAFFDQCRSDAHKELLGPSVCKPSPSWTTRFSTIFFLCVSSNFQNLSASRCFISLESSISSFSLNRRLK